MSTDNLTASEILCTGGHGNHLRRRHAQTIKDSSSDYKIDYVIVIMNFLNPEGHQNPISGSKLTAILLKGWILTFGGVSLGRVCACSLRSRLVNCKI